MSVIDQLAKRVGVQLACDALHVNRARYYRPLKTKEESVRVKPPLKLSDEEYQQAQDILYSERFVDQAPATIVADLLDEGRYICSERTFYRILKRNHALKERRRGHRRTHYAKPELLATKPNELWSWDITKLKGPVAWSYFHLYVILDVFSRYVVGWMIADRESAELAKKLIQNACQQQNIQPQQLTLHADRGASMKSKAVAHLLTDLGVNKSHSRPHTSDDNPYSEAQFKTLKYRPDFPQRFDHLEHAKQFCQPFFIWYNCQHKHSGIAMLTPQAVHYGMAVRFLKDRQNTLNQAFMQPPQRFKGKPPTIHQHPNSVWINKPDSTQEGFI